MILAGIDPVALLGYAIVFVIFLIVLGGLKLFLSGRRLYRWRFLMRTVARHRLNILVHESRFHGFLVAVAVVLAAAWLADHFTFQGAHVALSLAGFIGMGWLVFALPQRLVERYWSVVKASKFRICPDCYYELRGLGEMGRCPECGYDFCKEHLEADWRCLLGEGES